MNSDEQIPATEDATEDAHDLRGALESAFEEHVTDDAPTDATDDAPTDAQAPEAVESPAAQGAPPDAPTDAPTDAPIDAPIDAPKKSASIAKPPVGWSSDARAAWGDIPEAARAQIAERERGVAMTLQQTADARRVAKSFSETMVKHKDTISGLGYNDPMEGLNQIMQNVTTMRAGTPQQRANVAAEMMRTFNVDIGMLDDVLAEQGVPARANENAAIEQLLDKRLAPVNDLLSRLDSQKHVAHQQSQVTAQQDVGQFMADKPHAEQVRMEMADLLDMAAARGQVMSLDDAYSRACMMDPAIRSSIIAQERELQAEQARTQSASKRVASSSISGSPAGNSVPKQQQSLADTLSAAWDLHASGR